MYKTTIVLTLLSCLLTITTASEQNCSLNSTCYSRYAGLYYLTASTGNYTSYMLLTLRPDSSLTWTGNDQLGIGQVESTNASFRPYGSVNGKWICDSSINGQIRIKDYSFMYATADSPNDNYVAYDNFYLDVNNTRQIKGTYQYSVYNLNTTFLDETARTDDKYLQLDHDRIGDAVDYSATGYQVDRFC